MASLQIVINYRIDHVKRTLVRRPSHSRRAVAFDERCYLARHCVLARILRPALAGMVINYLGTATAGPPRCQLINDLSTRLMVP